MRIGQSDTLTGFFEAESYTVDGRGAGATTTGDIVATEATLHQDSPSVAWNANFTKVLSVVVGVRREVLRFLGLLLPEPV